MTIIVALKENNKIYLGCDSQGTAGRFKDSLENPKIFKTQGIYYGYCGSNRMGQILQYHSKHINSPMRKKDLYGYIVKHLVSMWRDILKSNGHTFIESNSEETNGEFLIVIDNQIFIIECDFQVAISSKNYVAIGSGSELAYGSLYTTGEFEFEPEERIQLALDAACEFNTACGGETIIKEL